MSEWYVYMISNAKHTGITNNLARRLRAHNGEIKGGAKATKSGRPWTLETFQPFATRREAAQREVEIKKWTRKRKLTWIASHKVT
jgi:predicted GIY-YIG superfamily endonuclease